MFIIICGWIGLIVLSLSSMLNLVNSIRGKSVRERAISFTGFIITVFTIIFIASKLFNLG